jgi:hypothetical protein
MKLGAAKTECRRSQLPRHGGGRVAHDPAAADVAELHLLDGRTDAFDRLERADLAEDPRPVWPEAQAMSNLEVAQRAGTLENRGLDVGTAESQPGGEPADARTHDQNPRHTHTLSGLSGISGQFQRFFSGRRDDRGVNWSPENKSKKTAAGAPASGTAGSADTTGGTAGAVTAVRLPERRSHEGKQQLELVVPSDERGGVSTPPIARVIRWLS